MTTGPGAKRDPAAHGPTKLTMHSPLSAIVRADPLTVTLEATVRQALEAMERLRLGEIVVTDRERRVPLGIFTLRDLLRRVTLPGGDLGQPIASVMTSGLITLEPRATAHQAAMTMARNGVRRVVVVESDGRLVGVLSQEDLFGLQRMGVGELSSRIQAAAGLPALREATIGIRRLTGDLLAQGTSAETLTHFISTLNDLLTARIIELTLDEIYVPPVPMCWIALGSEGRLEQTFATDQDNGIVFDAEPGEADRVRNALLPFARAVNEKLDACGFALCRGGIMAGNPQWCLPLSAWQRTFSSWIDEPQPEALLNATIFFDFRPVYGNEVLADRLRTWLLARAADRPVFLRLMAENALACEAPLGTFRDFVFDSPREFPHTIDLKTQGSRLFADAARIFGLASGVPQTSTAERLRAIPGETAETLAGLVDGFYFIHMLRLRGQHRPGGTPGGANRVDPRDLNDLDRHVLKVALRQARKLQSRLRVEYQLRT